MQPEPRATYRLQLQPGFGFDQAAKLIGYLVDLGISHMYLSPCLQSAKDSTHGYDVVDPSHVNFQLGDADSHQRLCEELQKAGLGLMLDIVPNHMAIEGKQNPWWWDVLENGFSSAFATYFDVDWEASEKRWCNKILLPVLGDHYGRVLENGEIKLLRQEGSFIILYQDHSFPVDPSSLAELINNAAKTSGSEQLAFLAESYTHLPKATTTTRQEVERRHRDKTVLASMLAKLCNEEPETNQAINREIERINNDPDALDAFIDHQNYRLAFWRTASRDLGYRRFFDIKDLVGLRCEDIDVFNATHALPIAWYSKGWVQGLRVDHPDGLRNPSEYFIRLQNACTGAWVVAEKILKPGERLPLDWNIAGTTGYDFVNLITELFIDPQGEQALTQTYQDITGENIPFCTRVASSKRLVLKGLFGSELNRLATLFVEVCEKHRRHRDYTRSELYEALCEVAVNFPVYRTYVSSNKGEVSKEDEKYVNEAIQGALAEKPDLDPELFNFLKEILLLKVEGQLENELAMRFQQLTGPAMAKGFEDTVLYRYNRLIALNDVGMEPSIFGITLKQFHDTCQEQSQRPYSLLATTTHDTKRSEDVRARLSLLSEIPEQWDTAVKRWFKLNENCLQEGVPDRNLEYFIYQTLVGAWPINKERLEEYIEKAMREAKEHTSWTQPHQDYENGVKQFISAVLQNESFLSELKRFVDVLEKPGRVIGLAQTLIKLTAPGIPDIFQGSELWNMTLVDPDNRRKVDFELRQNLLSELKNLSVEQVLAKMDSGLPKLWLIKKVLHFRKENPDLFNAKGTYKPLWAKGKNADHVVSYMRGDSAVVITPRLVLQLNDEWGDTSLDLPTGSWHSVLTGDKFQGGIVTLQELLQHFPVALLQKV
ncbi:MAG: malto-oligosyltrehalose synthase [Parachlamydiales bacterium]|jgi:(1->4)-alpha-D-glucan 1-alpha-D-glucosylmutase